MGKICNVQPLAGSSNITIDSALSNTSKNPVQNKVITIALNDYQMQTLTSAITIDGTSKTTVESALVALASLANSPITPVNPSSTPTENGSIWIETA